MSYENVSVIIPCHNEEAAIARVVTEFKEYLPKAKIYVYDNQSTDQTQQEAKKSGAIVRYEQKKGKGNVVRRMFSDVDSDIYLLVDGDLTYDASVAPEMINYLVDNGLDMLNISRKGLEGSYRNGHRFGNYLLTKSAKIIFGTELEDMLSGYRVFSKRFVKTFPSRSNEFEIETELTVHSLEMKLPIGERSAKYVERPEGSVSKLSTYRDGFKILFMINKLFFLVRPVVSFSILSAILFILSIGIGWMQVIEPLIDTGAITKYPSVILSSSLMILSIFLFSVGIVISSVSNARKDQFRFFYLSYSKEK
jgi:glycosyltransferase involved in cell wall biosynthesis